MTSEPETERFGTGLGRRIDRGLCVSLVGSLGSGKSVLVRGICRGLDVGEDVLSPTFILFEEYAGRLPVIHLDLYRLEHERDIEELGVFDRLGDQSVILVEWGDRSERILDISDVVLHLEVVAETQRRIRAEFGNEFAGLLEGAGK
jgi:tRNA threonylcarbamoyladenosine biosynthesis protein TsaE